MIHPTRYFSATSSTLEFLIEEQVTDPDDKETLREAAEIVAKAEGDIFHERQCPECRMRIKGTDGKDVERKLDSHKAAIHP